MHKYYCKQFKFKKKKKKKKKDNSLSLGIFQWTSANKIVMTYPTKISTIQW